MEPIKRPDSSTSVLGPLSYLFTCMWHDNHNLSVELGMDRSAKCAFINAKMNQINKNKIDFTWLTEGRCTDVLKEKALVGLVDLHLMVSMLKPKLQRMLKARERDLYSLIENEVDPSKEQTVLYKHPDVGTVEAALQGVKSSITIAVGGKTHPVLAENIIWEMTRLASYPKAYFAIYPRHVAIRLSMVIGDFSSFIIPPLQQDPIHGAIDPTIV